jgi:polyisoprenoid-binding protein YceI
MTFRSLAVVGALLATTPALAADYVVDSSHTRVGFSISHLTVSTVRGSFGEASGTVSYDPKNVAATKVNAKVTVGSVDTREAKRDEHLRSPDFFDAVKFPEMTFASTAVKNISKDGFDLVGDLTIHGVTKPVTLRVATFSPEVKDPWGNVKVGTRATGTINRKDFGLTWNAALETGGFVVGEEVALELDIELKKN